jgi:hypothetical protein
MLAGETTPCVATGVEDGLVIRLQMVRTVRHPVYWLTYCFEWKEGCAITPSIRRLHNGDHQMAPCGRSLTGGQQVIARKIGGKNLFLLQRFRHHMVSPAASLF